MSRAQFLKLGAAGALPGLSEHFLIWDLDMVPLRPLPLLTPVEGKKKSSGEGGGGETGGSSFQVGLHRLT